MRNLLLLVVITSICFLSGCFGADTSDPRRGGLFGYSPKNYQARLDERQDYLDELEEERAYEESKTAKLEQTKSAKQAKLRAQRQQIANVDSKIKALRKNPRVDQSRVNNLARRQAALQRESERISSGSIEAKEAKVRQMQSELRELQAEADALSRM